MREAGPDASGNGGPGASISAGIASSRAGEITLVAVPKGLGRAEIERARASGVYDIGESYAQELLSKADDIPSDVCVHFIGRIQRNKVRKIADSVDLWHSVARAEIVTELAKRVDGPEILVQIRHEQDPTKDGVLAQELPAILELAQESGVRVRGLMTMGIFGDLHATATVFAATRTLAESHGLAELSMGMSGDYRVALDEGATMLRLGTVLFGPRPAR